MSIFLVLDKCTFYSILILTLCMKLLSLYGPSFVKEYVDAVSLFEFANEFFNILLVTYYFSSLISRIPHTSMKLCNVNNILAIPTFNLQFGTK